MVSSRDSRSEIVSYIENAAHPLRERVKILDEFEQNALLLSISRKYQFPADRGWWWEFRSRMTKEEITHEDIKYYDRVYLYEQLGADIYFIAARDTFPDQWIILKCNVGDVDEITNIFDEDIEYYLFSNDLNYGVLNSNEGYLRIVNFNANTAK